MGDAPLTHATDETTRSGKIELVAQGVRMGRRSYCRPHRQLDYPTISEMADSCAGVAGFAAKAGTTKVVAVSATAATRARRREETDMTHSR